MYESTLPRDGVKAERGRVCSLRVSTVAADSGTHNLPATTVHFTPTGFWVISEYMLMDRFGYYFLFGWLDGH